MFALEVRRSNYCIQISFTMTHYRELRIRTPQLRGQTSSLKAASRGYILIHRCPWQKTRGTVA
jgi:hypothetical protein